MHQDSPSHPRRLNDPCQPGPRRLDRDVRRHRFVDRTACGDGRSAVAASARTPPGRRRSGSRTTWRCGREAHRRRSGRHLRRCHTRHPRRARLDRSRPARRGRGALRAAHRRDRAHTPRHRRSRRPHRPTRLGLRAAGRRADVTNDRRRRRRLRSPAEPSRQRPPARRPGRMGPVHRGGSKDLLDAWPFPTGGRRTAVPTAWWRG